MERMLTEENFIKAERLIGKNKRDNKMAVHISKHAEKYGKKLFRKVIGGDFKWHEPRESKIVDSYKGKERNLKIPCLEDQAAQMAWLNIAAPYIERRNYYYNCGSVPHAGQTRCVKALQKWLKAPRMKYGAVTDIRKFYDTCPHLLIRKGLLRIFKDYEFVEFAMGFVASMSKTDVGIAIGYPSSHWLANVALMELDHELKRRFPDVKYARYMDDMAMACPNKRHIRKAVVYVRAWLEAQGMKLKKWMVIKVKRQGLSFLSYRFYHGYTLLKKRLMIRISRRMKKAAACMNAHVASGVISYFGVLKYCNSYHFREAHVYPYTNKKLCTRLISMQSRRKAVAA